MSETVLAATINDNMVLVALLAEVVEYANASADIPDYWIDRAKVAIEAATDRQDSELDRMHDAITDRDKRIQVLEAALKAMAETIADPTRSLVERHHEAASIALAALKSEGA